MPDYPYPTIDAELGEHYAPDEEVLARKLSDVIETAIRAYPPGAARRDAHPKATGLVKAELRVHDDLPADLAVGIFSPGKTYEALLRFSNGSADPTQSDDNEDGRGVAVKVLGVPGDKILEQDRHATTQDFVFIDHPVFFINQPNHYISLLLQKAGVADAEPVPPEVGEKAAGLFQLVSSGKIANPLQVRYFSATPYQFGLGPNRRAVKYSLKPASDHVDPLPAERGPDYLREAMRATLADGSVDLTLMIQPRTDDAMDVEDVMTEWPEDRAPFHEVATIHIGPQEFDTPERDELGENLVFSPWHSLPEHRPLGVTNRLRKAVYERISAARHEINGVELSEP